jgi:hypothetical protein
VPYARKVFVVKKVFVIMADQGGLDGGRQELIKRLLQST